MRIDWDSGTIKRDIGIVGSWSPPGLLEQEQGRQQWPREKCQWGAQRFGSWPARNQSIWVNLITTSLFSLTGIMVHKGNHPQMAQQFRLVKYYNLPRSINQSMNVLVSSRIDLFGGQFFLQPKPGTKPTLGAGLAALNHGDWSNNTGMGSQQPTKCIKMLYIYTQYIYIYSIYIHIHTYIYQ